MFAFEELEKPDWLDSETEKTITNLITENDYYSQDVMSRLGTKMHLNTKQGNEFCEWYFQQKQKVSTYI